MVRGGEGRRGWRELSTKTTRVAIDRERENGRQRLTMVDLFTLIASSVRVDTRHSSLTQCTECLLGSCSSAEPLLTITLTTVTLLPMPP